MCLLLCSFGTLPCIGTIVALNVAVSTNRKVRQHGRVPGRYRSRVRTGDARVGREEGGIGRLSENSENNVWQVNFHDNERRLLGLCIKHRKVKSPGDTPGVEIKTLAPIPEFRKPSGFPRMPCRDFPRGHIPRPDFR